MDERSETVMHPAQAIAEGNRSIAILYGSETGNAEEIASELASMTERLHFDTMMDEMDGFKLSDLLRFTLVIFITSTTGQGEMPGNTSKFWKSLRRGKLNNTNCLTRLRFAIFGLGDSSYQKFNWAARKLQVRLLQLGASEFYRSGEADERHDNGIDSIYLPWYQDLRKLLLEHYPPARDPIPDNVLLPSKYFLRLASPEDSSSLPTVSSSMEDQSDQARFEATKTKSAALTHIDNPRSEAEELDVHRVRRRISAVGIIARKDDSWERMTGARVDYLDKSNVLTDDPSKYLLKPRELDTESPPEHLLPIPNAFLATVIRNDRLTPEDHWQDVRMITLNLIREQEDGRIVPADIPPGSTVMIHPKNFPGDVDTIIDLMGWQDIADLPLRWGYQRQEQEGTLNTTFVRRPRIHADEDSNLRDLLINNFDFMSVPKRNFIRELAFFAADEREKERLGELCNMGNEQEYYDYTSRPRRTILELLQDFPSVRIPWQRAMDLFPVIRGREFSIANGGAELEGIADPMDTTIHVVAALVEYKTIIRKPRQGLCSRYLRSLPLGTDIMVTFKFSKDSFFGPSKTMMARPVIAIATGTGIAPIRALIQERDMWRDKTRVGPLLLFFGCRNRTADFHFENEWYAYPDVHVVPAFSRDPVTPAEAKHLDPYPIDVLDTIPPQQGGTGTTPKSALADGTVVFDYDRGKNYVQHQIRKHADLVCAVLRQRAQICICGNSGRMPTSVRQALADAVVKGGLAEDEKAAQDIFRDPDRVGWWQETW